MLDLTTEQCSEYVNKIVSLAESAGCKVSAVCSLMNCCISAISTWSERLIYNILSLACRQVFSVKKQSSGSCCDTPTDPM